MLTFAIVILLLAAVGYVQMRSQSRLRENMAKLPPDARRRMVTVFPVAMGVIIALVFVALYFLRKPA